MYVLKSRVHLPCMGEASLIIGPDYVTFNLLTAGTFSTADRSKHKKMKKKYFIKIKS